MLPTNKTKYAFVVSDTRTGYPAIYKLNGDRLMLAVSREEADTIIELLDTAYQDGLHRQFAILNQRHTRGR